MNDRPRCVHCGDIVGVYEPARLLLADGTERHGSALTLGAELGTPCGVLVHERCYEPFDASARTVPHRREPEAPDPDAAGFDGRPGALGDSVIGWSGRMVRRPGLPEACASRSARR